MRYAVLSDIHANWEALEAALDYLAKQTLHEIWVLGDTLGYGANPNECFEWMLENADVCLMGNHEKAVIDPKLREDFNPDACTAVEWTAEVLKPELQLKIQKLPYLHITSSSTLAHGSPDEPQTFRYLFNFEEARPSFQAFQTPLCFVGHTHLPSQFIESEASARRLFPGTSILKKEQRYILNPGSVGQPRDSDPRLAFGIFDDEDWKFEMVRLKYDHQKAAAKIRKAGLPPYLADRLL